MRARFFAILLGTALVAGTISTLATAADADSQTTTNAPLTCQTRFGVQGGLYTTTVTDDVDPVAAGGAVSYRFSTPFKQTLPGGISGSYKGGQNFLRIPAGLNVTSVSTQQPPGGSPLVATAAIQGSEIVVTTSGSIPIDGQTHQTPNLIVQATTSPTAGGTQIRWLLPRRIIANVDVNGIGPVDADCVPVNPNTVTGTTNVLVPGNRAPVVTNRSFPVTQNTAKSIVLSATDADNDPITFSVDTPKHGAVTLNGSTAVYTPTTGFLGPDSFTYTASDGRGGDATARVDLDVHSPAEGDTYPPVVTVPVPAKGAVYTPGQVVQASYTCTDGESLQSCTGTVANGTAINTTPGVHSFSVTAVDNGLNTTKTTFTYRVMSRTPVNQGYSATPNQPNVIPITCNQIVVPFTQRIPAVVAAPLQVPQADTFIFRISPGSMSVLPSTVATNAKYIVNAPTGGTIIDVRTVPGTGSANAANSVASIVSGKAVLTVPSVDGGLTGTSFTPRQMEVTVRATGAPTTQVTTKFDRFQMRLTTGQAGQNILTTDYDCPGGAAGAPNPTLTRTTVVDVTPPTVSIGSPVHGGRYMTGASVPAQYTCTDAHGVTSCTGTVANGQPIFTSAQGGKLFSVTSTDTAGNASTVVRSYKIFNPISITTAFSTADQAQLQAASAFFGIPVTDLPGVVVYLLSLQLGTNFDPAPVAPPPAGPRPFVVTTRYLPNDAALVRFNAGRYGVSGEDFHWYGGQVAIALYQLYS